MAVEESSFEPKPFGRYVLLDKLAMGGMAEIYKAKTYGVDGFEKLLAIKRILPHCAADKEFINMLVDEAKLTVLLSHANIVQVYDLGKVGEDYFISMEFINGTNLREVIHRLKKKGEKIPQEIAVYITSEMCKGLDYAHRKTDSQGVPLNIVHRDISPQNILISYEGEVKIVDFGIAKAAMNVSHTMAGILKGKIAYMSPEQALGKPLDHRTDLFSVGIVLHEMLTGEKLFTGETQFEVLNQIRSTRVTTTILPDSIPGPLKGILAKALAYLPKDRYEKVADLQLDLTKYLYSSYVDFSPRQLATIVTRLFEKEIKRKEKEPEINDKTRSVIMSQKTKEDIVVHGSEITDIPVVPKRGKFFRMAASVGVLAVLGIGGWWGYKNLFLTQETAKTKPVPLPTPVPAADLGGFQVSSTPMGATILLNNADTGLKTPARLEKLKIGETYEITLAKEKYKDFSKKYVLTTTEPILISESLKPLPLGVIDIASNPQGAKIVMNGQETGLKTPHQIEKLEIPKEYQLKLILDGHADWTSSVQVKDLDPVKLVASLTKLPELPPPETRKPEKPLPAKKKETPTVATKFPPPPSPPEPASPSKAAMLRLDSEPGGAEVYLDAEYKGTTPVALNNVRPGSVKLVILKEGFMRHIATLNLQPGEERSLGTIKLEGLYGEVSINSTPPRARIYFDGELIDPKTPVTIQMVPRDRNHQVRIELEGYKPWETSFSLGDKSSKRYNVTLEKE